MTTRNPAKSRTYIFSLLAAFILLTIGFGLRMFDLTDQPIDFHPTRQLRNAIVARGIYYQLLPAADPEIQQKAVAFGVSTGQYEPPIVETITAIGYLLSGGEKLWVSRIITSLFWILGGVALFDLSRRLARENDLRAHPTLGALVALAYYLILPFAVQASRSFQPDPGMVMWIILTFYALYRWSETPTWKWALLAGLCGGIAILTKVVAIYMVGGIAIALVLFTYGIKRLWKNPQIWTMAVLMISPSLTYYLSRGGRASEYFSTWTVALSHLLLDPATYVRWLSLVQNLMGLSVLLLALFGVLIARPRTRSLLLGAWIGYFTYGLFFPYQMYTHNYYHLPLVPLIAISLIPPASLLISKLVEQPRWIQALAILIAMGGMLYPAWVSIAEQMQEDHRNEPVYWQEVASHLPGDGKIIALTQDYGYRLMYYGWHKVTLWPPKGERKLSELRGSQKEFEAFFQKRTEGKKYFLITAFGQFNSQPDLKTYLNENYPIAAEGNGYLIFDLQAPTNPQ